MLHQFINTVFGVFSQMGYLGIFVMMMIESSFLPFPSEVVMIPAGALAQKGEMNFLIALFAGTAGAYFGSVINYFLGYYLGAPVVKKIIAKYGKYIFLSGKHYAQAEKFFEKKGGITTFLGRFIPAVRQLISIPAGVFKMNFAKFSLFTIAGAACWNLILLSIGYFASDKQELILHYFKEIIVVLVLIVAIFIIYKIYSKKKK